MSVNEEFNDKIESEDISNDLHFRIAQTKDIEAIFEMMSLRNPDLDREMLKSRTVREIKELNDGKDYGVFVCEYEDKVVAFCRFYHSESVPKEKVKFESSVGYYGMGIIVHPSMRRKGIARFISMHRFQWLQNLGAQGIYSCVAMDNLTSQRMHESLGFKKIKKSLEHSLLSSMPARDFYILKNSKLI